MEEYKKIANVTKKIDPGAPHDVILVLDATSGQNIISQVEEFNKIIPVTGISDDKARRDSKRRHSCLRLAKKYELPISCIRSWVKKIDDLQIFESRKVC